MKRNETVGSLIQPLNVMHREAQWRIYIDKKRKRKRHILRCKNDFNSLQLINLPSPSISITQIS